MRKTFCLLFAVALFLSAACDGGQESGFFTVTVRNNSDYDITDLTVYADGMAPMGAFPFLAELKKGESHLFNCEVTPKNPVGGDRVKVEYTLNGKLFEAVNAVGAVTRDGVYWVPKYALDGSRVYITITNANWEMNVEGGITD